MNRHSCMLRALTAIVPMLLAPTAGARLPEQDRKDPLEMVEAIWKAQSFEFAYAGRSTIYSCDALRKKLQQILQGLGARDTLTIHTLSCDDAIGGGSFRIDLESPVLATPENIQAQTTYDSKQILVSRVREERLLTPEEVERFAATWKTVSFRRDRQLKLNAGDCELVQQLRRSVLPRLSIRIEYERLHCSVAFGNSGQPQLRVTALVATSNTDKQRLH